MIKMAHQQYKLDGVIYPSVTEILRIVAKPGLVAWANSMGLAGKSTKDESQRIAGIGTEVHARIEQYFKEGTSIFEGATAEALPSLHLFNNWIQKHKIEPILIEESMISPKLGYAGTIDLLAKVDDKLTLIDFKTSNRIYEDYFAQLCAYKRLLSEKGFVPEAMLIIRLGKDHEVSFEEKEVKNEQLYLEYFDAVFNLYKILKKVEIKR